MPATVGDIRRMERDLKAASSLVIQAEDVLVVTHIDADGISAGAIADITLDRLGKEHEVRFEKKITDEVIACVNSAEEDLVWICDLGSGYLSKFRREGLVVTDHHIPDPEWHRAQTSLDRFFGTVHLNPHEYGMDGSYEVCGAGMTYFLSKTIDSRNTDLAHLAVIGAVGDFQDSSSQRLVSLNAEAVKDAVAVGDMRAEEDLRYFGRDTRPVSQYLRFATNPSIPGLSGNPRGCVEFLESLGIPTKDEEGKRAWSNLTDNEREAARDGIMRLLGDDALRAVGEMYRIVRYDKSTGLGDAKEFATVLNACGRYGDAPTGLLLCRGDVSALKTAENNRAEHRKHVSSAMSYVRNNHLLRERRFIQWFDAGSEIGDTVVGIVAGMILSSRECRRNIPIIAFADTDEGTKVSARANRELADRGLNLAEAMKIASGLVGGYGGGHTVAAGATIPSDTKEKFLDIVEDIVASQVE